MIEKQAAGAIQNAEDFGLYRRLFLTIAAFLKKKDRLSDREISVYFMEGLDGSFRAKVQSQLKAEKPKHHSDDPYTLPQISEAALFVLSCSYGSTMKESEPTMPSIKKEHFDMSNLDSKYMGNANLSTLVSEIVKQLNLQTGNQGNQGPSRAFSPRIRSQNSNFCSDPGHFMKGRTGQLDGCKDVIDYIR